MLFHVADQSQLSLLLRGTKAWNDWRTGAGRDVKADLSRADLSGKDLSGADLRGANFDSASLHNARLGRGTLLCNADFSRADLYQADLSGADLLDANFGSADLFEVKLREANLQGADLHQANGGLRTEQLAGADLTGAKLSDQLTKLYDALENVKGISESARKLFLAVLAACLYSWLTIATTTDINLITNRNSSPLPIIQTSIPIVGFYVVAPLLILCIYFYFHFYLQKLWEELGSLPAVFPDGRPLHAKVDPWLLNDLVRSHLPKLSVNRPFLSYFQLWISILLAWWVAPITMLLFWGRYLRRHELIGTTFHVVLLVISLVAAVCLCRLAVATLCGTERESFMWKKVLTSRRTYHTAAFAGAVGVLFGLLSVGAIGGVRSGAPFLGSAPWSERYFDPAYGLRTWVPRAMALFGYAPFANLETADISQKKSTWTGKKGQDPDSVIAAQLSGTDLRYASADRAFFANADLEEADLRGAHLNEANLSGADLSYAHLNEADLWGADLSGAKLYSADLWGADLSGRTDLSSADLRSVDLRNADLSGGADLSGADLSGADLMSADLNGADLEKTHLKGAYLYFSNLMSTKNLNPEQVKNAKYWDHAFYDNDMLKPLALASDHNQKLAQSYAKLFPSKGVGLPDWVRAYLQKQ